MTIRITRDCAFFVLDLGFIGLHFHRLHWFRQDDPGASVHPGRNENKKVSTSNCSPSARNETVISEKANIVLIDVFFRVADPHHFNPDPDSAFHFNANPDPAVHFNADPYPQQCDENLRQLV